MARAGQGDQQAWDALVERYAPLIWSVCRCHGLSGAAAADVGQTVWLRLVDHLAEFRDPAALPGWLTTTTRRECGRVRRSAVKRPAAGYPVDVDTVADEQTTAEEELLTAGRNAALREAFADLPPGCQRLLTFLVAPEPLSYAEISAALGVPAESIGHSRHRCLDKLRRHPAITAAIDAALVSNRPAGRGSASLGS